MTPSIRADTEARAARNAKLLEAERQREQATRDAEIDYSETVRKLREHFEADLAEAAALRLVRVSPAHRAYIAAVVAAEHAYRQRLTCLEPVS
jgi:hypothetical protein